MASTPALSFLPYILVPVLMALGRNEMAPGTWWFHFYIKWVVQAQEASDVLPPFYILYVIHLLLPAHSSPSDSQGPDQNLVGNCRKMVLHIYRENVFKCNYYLFYFNLYLLHLGICRLQENIDIVTCTVLWDLLLWSFGWTFISDPNKSIITKKLLSIKEQQNKLFNTK